MEEGNYNDSNGNYTRNNKSRNDKYSRNSNRNSYQNKGNNGYERRGGRSNDNSHSGGYMEQNNHAKTRLNLSDLKGALDLDEHGENLYHLPREQVTFIEQAKKLLEGNAKDSPEYQYQFAYTIYNQLIGLDENERLLFLNLKVSNEVIKTFLLWSDSQIFYGFLDALKNAWKYLARGKFSSGLVQAVLTQLIVDRDSDDNELKEKAEAAINDLTKDLGSPSVLISDPVAWIVMYKIYKLYSNDSDRCEFIKSVKEYIKKNPKWFAEEGTSVSWGKFFDKFVSYSVKEKDNLSEVVAEEMHSLWETLLQIPISTIFKSSKLPSKLNLSSEQRKYFLSLFNHRASAEILQFFLEKVSQNFHLHFHSEFLADEMDLLTENENGVYIIVSFLKSAKDKETLAAVIKTLTARKLSYYWHYNMRNLVNIIAEISAKWSLEQANIFEALDSMVRHPIRRMDENSTGPAFERKNLVEHLILKSAENRGRDKFDRFGAQTLCHLFDFDTSIIKPLFNDFKEFSKHDLTDLCEDRWGTLVVEKWVETLFSSKTSMDSQELEAYRDDLMLKFTGKVMAYACDLFGSRVMEKLISALDTTRLKFILDEYILGEEESKKSKYSKILFAKFGLQGYKINPTSWLAQHEKSKRVASMFSDILGDSDTKSGESKNSGKAKAAEPAVESSKKEDKNLGKRAREDEGGRKKNKKQKK